MKTVVGSVFLFSYASAAALDSGVAMAEVANLTLAGFVRGKRMNIYNAPEYLATCKF